MSAETFGIWADTRAHEALRLLVVWIQSADEYRADLARRIDERTAPGAELRSFDKELQALELEMDQLLSNLRLAKIIHTALAPTIGCASLYRGEVIW